MRRDTNITMSVLRHGEVAGGPRYRGRTDDPLTARGWEQMWAAVDGAGEWECVVASPLSRCAHFARTFAERHRLPLHLDARLQEIDFGVWEGRSAEEIMESSPGTLDNFYRDPWRNGPPGGESLEHMHARVLDAWDDLCARGRPALVIGHGGPIRVILCHHFGWAREKLLCIDVSHAALYRLDLPAAGFRAASASMS